jgi:carbamate kinase
VVSDKDHAGVLLGREIEADIHIMTAAPADFVGFGTPGQKPKVNPNPHVLLAEREDESETVSTFAKVMVAAGGFARSTARPALTRALSDISHRYHARLDGRYPHPRGITAVVLAPSQACIEPQRRDPFPPSKRGNCETTF